MVKHKGQFKKGNPGGPGHPGGQNRGTIARKWLAMTEKAKNPITKKEEKLTQEEIMTLAQMGIARKGDTRAYNALMDSAHGKAVQPTDITSKGESIIGAKGMTDKLDEILNEPENDTEEAESDTSVSK